MYVCMCWCSYLNNLLSGHQSFTVKTHNKMKQPSLKTFSISSKLKATIFYILIAGRCVQSSNIFSAVI